MKSVLGITKIARSPRLRVPSLWVGESNLWPWTWAMLAYSLRDWSFRKLNDNSYQAKHQGDTMNLTAYHAWILAVDWRYWPKWYLPRFPLEGKTVLDAGAGCGETVHLFCLYGAKKVICVESDPLAQKLLSSNARRNSWPVEIHGERFRVEHLDGVDFAKIDVEGGEACLVEAGSLPPLVLEYHSDAIGNHLQLRFPGLVQVRKPPASLLFSNSPLQAHLPSPP